MERLLDVGFGASERLDFWVGAISPQLARNGSLKRIITGDTPKDVHPEDPSKIFVTVRDRLDFYRNEIQCETTVLSDRSNAYLGAQSFLVVVYASTMANLNSEWGKFFTLVLPVLLAVFGLALSIQAWPGLKSSYNVIDHWYAKQTFMMRNEPLASADRDGAPLFHHRETMKNGNNKALAFSMRTPWIFGSLWVLLGCFSAYVHF